MTDDDDDLMAAEYVLGTLDAAERQVAEGRRFADKAFEDLVLAWERRLSALSESSPDAEPPRYLWAEILRRIDRLAPNTPVPGADAGNVVTLHRAVRRWRAATALVSALAACLAAWVAVGELRPSAPAAPTLVAFLQKADDAPAYLMRADLDDRTLAVKPLAAVAPAGKSYELWVIDPSIGAPKSLGLLDPGTSRHPLPATVPQDVLSRATYAVTEEPPGGSPTGSPSGTPVFVGHLVSSRF